LSGIGRVCAWGVWRRCACAWVWRSLAERVVGYQARLCLGTADPVGCVVRYRARVCAWVWWSLSGV
jgi:hypothetical protein